MERVGCFPKPELLDSNLNWYSLNHNHYPGLLYLGYQQTISDIDTDSAFSSLELIMGPTNIQTRDRNEWTPNIVSIGRLMKDSEGQSRIVKLEYFPYYLRNIKQLTVSVDEIERQQILDAEATCSVDMPTDKTHPLPGLITPAMLKELKKGDQSTSWQVSFNGAGPIVSRNLLSGLVFIEPTTLPPSWTTLFKKPTHMRVSPLDKSTNPLKWHILIPTSLESY